MRKYWAVAKTSFQEYLAYRLNFGLEVVGGVLFTLVTIWLWQAVASGKPSGVVGEYASSELVTYLLGAGIITSYYFLTAQGDEVNDDINRGFLSALLVKPINPLWNWFVRDQARKLMTFAIGALGFIVVALLFRHLILPPVSPGFFIIFLSFFLLASLLHFLLYTLFALFAFWSEQTWGERFVIRVISELASGMIIPLTLLPNLLQSLVQYLPFRFFAFVPMQLYLGKLTTFEIITEFILLMAWITVLSLTVSLTMRRGLRQYAGEGI